jgi:hypothetical protein
METGNLNGSGIAELQNYNIQNLDSAPTTSLKKGRIYFNTVDNTLYVYDGTQWLDALSQGIIYQEGGGIDITNATISIDLATGANAGNVTFTTTNGLAGTVADASTSVAGVIEIATDSEASTGTSETLAVNPKQLATKVTGNTAITGATKTKITYDSKGLVTAGDDLTVSDIPNLSLSKITDVTATASEVNVLDGITASTSELNVLDGITASTTELNYTDGVTSNIQTQLDNKLDEKPDGINDLIDSANKITLSYMPDVVLGQMLYAGTFVPSTALATLTTNAKTKLGTSSDTITLTNNTTAITGYEDNEGNYYIASTDGDFANISFLTGDWLLSTGSGWTKIDNTDAVTGVKGAAESTYRIGNVNITADNVLPTQTSNSGKFLGTDGTNCSWQTVDALPSQSGQSGKFLTTNGTNASWQGIRYYTTNPAIQVDSSGIGTWTVTHNLNTIEVSVTVYEYLSGEQVWYDTALASANAVTIKLLSASDIPENSYRVVIKG